MGKPAYKILRVLNDTDMMRKKPRKELEQLFAAEAFVLWVLEISPFTIPS